MPLTIPLGPGILLLRTGRKLGKATGSERFATPCPTDILPVSRRFATEY
jgi:hypothetical protein